MNMKDHLKKVSLTIPALLLAFTTLAVVPAFASHGSDDPSVATGTAVPTSGDGQKVSTSNGSTISTSGSGDKTTENQTEVRAESTVASDDSQTAELHSKGKDMVTELQKDHKSKLTDTERQKVCEVHKQGLTNKFTVIARNSLSYQARIDDVFAKAQVFQASKNITSVDLIALLATANTAKHTSATSVSNLQALTPTLDCNNASVAQDVATFKASASQTRTDLKAYKTAVKAVVQALKTAVDTNTEATKTTTTTEKSN